MHRATPGNSSMLRALAAIHRSVGGMRDALVGHGPGCLVQESPYPRSHCLNQENADSGKELLAMEARHVNVSTRMPGDVPAATELVTARRAVPTETAVGANVV